MFPIFNKIDCRGKTLVTGASGHLGSKVYSDLKQTKPIIGLYQTTKVANLFKKDLSRLSEVKKLKGIENIIHLATLATNNFDKIISKELTIMNNLCSIWEKGSFIYTSSTVIHGVPNQTLTTLSALEPIHYYDWGKISAEFLIKRRFSELDQNQAQFQIVRFPLLFSSDPKFLNRQYLYFIFLNAIKNKSFIIENEQEHGVSWIGQNDLSNFIVDLLNIKSSHTHIVSSAFITWKELISKIIEITGSKSIIRTEENENGLKLPCSKTLVKNSSFHKNWDPQDNINIILEDYWNNLQKVGIKHE